MTRSTTLPGVAVVAAATVILLGGRFEGRIEELGIERPEADELPPLLGESGRGGTLLAPVILGVFRPVAIDLLWLRSVGLERRGRYFESAAIARAITTLEPRLPKVWSFLAWNLAYNISAFSPPEDRFRWVSEGIRLLTDGGLRHNPDSLSLYSELTFMFLNRLDPGMLGGGADVDEARLLWEGLAGAFEPPPSLDDSRSREWRARTLGEWGMDPARLRELSRYARSPPGGDPADGTPDLRTAATHALYWAEAGLSIPAGPSGRVDAHRLRLYRDTALQRLFLRGRVLRAPVRRLHVFLPDLRFLDTARGVLEAEVEEAAELGPDVVEVATATRTRFRATAIAWLVVSGRREEAERWFQRYRDDVVSFVPAGSAEDVAVRYWAPESVEADWGKRREDVLARLAGLLDASILLDLSGAADVARGFAGLASDVRARWTRASSGARLPPASDLHLAVAGDIYRELTALRPELADRLQSSLRPVLGDLRDAPEAGSLGVPASRPFPRGIDPAPFGLLAPPEEEG